MIRALFTAIAALALAIGTALWFDDDGARDPNADDLLEADAEAGRMAGEASSGNRAAGDQRSPMAPTTPMDGGGEDDPVTATAEPASAVDPAPAVRAEEGPAVARSGLSTTKHAPPGAELGGGSGASTPETVELGRPDFGPEPSPDEEPDGPRLVSAPLDPERSAALIRRMLALYEVVRE